MEKISPYVYPSIPIYSNTKLKPTKLSPKTISKLVSKYYKIPVKEVLAITINKNNPNNKYRFLARYFIAFFLFQKKEMSHGDISKVLKRNRCTITDNLQVLSKKINKDILVRIDLFELNRMIDNFKFTLKPNYIAILEP